MQPEQDTAVREPRSTASTVRVRASSRRRRRTISVLATVAGLGAAALVLRDTVPHPGEVVDALRSATAGWLATAVVAQLVSMDMFARQQRRLLGAFGVTMSLSRAEALTYARSALSISMPAGAVVSAGFAYRQYQSRGASHRTAASVMLLSGVLSAVALTMLYIGWIGAVTVAGPALAHPTFAAAVIATILVMAGGGAAVVNRRADRRAAVRFVDEPSPPGLLHRLAARRPWVARVVSPVADALASAEKIRRRDWAVSVAFAAGNWIADLGCLIAVAYAFGLTLSVVQIAGGYLLVQLVRQVPITPGGIGVIEASLLVALVAAGAPQVTAAGVVLVYRVLSCWAIVPAGLLAWVGLQFTRRDPARSDPARSDPARSDPARTR